MFTRFTFDNDSLSKILNNLELSQQLFELIEKRDVRIYIPSQVLIECFSGESEMHVMARWERLISLYNQTDLKKVRFCRTTHEIIQAEVIKLGQLNDVPVLGAKRVLQTYICNQEQFRLLLPKLREDAVLYRKRREDRIQRDRNFRQGAIDLGLSQEDLRQKLLNYNPTQIPRELFSMLSSDLETFLSKRQLRKALRRERHSTASTLTHLLAFNYISVACSHQDPALARWCRLDENNWVDVFIAASAAYSNYFVTEDVRLSSICNQLRDQGAIFFQAINQDTAFERMRILNET